MQQQVLLIDDSKSIHTLVTSLLADEPLTIHSAYDAAFGLVQAASLRPDLILLDVDMPEVDGYEACRRLKADAATAGIPVIFLTAKAATEELVRGLDLGASDYVAKPFKLSELLSRVRAALRTGHLIRLLEDKALIDPLTGLGNRALFNKRLAAEVALRIKSNSPLACAVLEVDNFSKLADRYGHPFGDHVLGKIGAALLELCPVEYVACRYRGPAFAILTPQATAAQAAELVERFRRAAVAIPFNRQNVTITVTCSTGVAEAGDAYDRGILERAEQAMGASPQPDLRRAPIGLTMPPSRSAA